MPRFSHPTLLRLSRAQQGATAIEYAIIAGLIGLGLVGSLVTTRGSLSAIFGTAGSQMSSAASATASGGSAGGGAAAGPVTATSRAQYWQGKTIASKTVSGNTNMTSFTYTDGSSGYVSRSASGNVYEFWDATAFVYSSVYYDKSGVQNYAYNATYSDKQRSAMLTQTYAETFANGTPQTMTNKTWNANGTQILNQSGVAVTPEFLAINQSNIYDAQYHLGLAGY
jgi:pilus assembly protein Flp/PilA